MKTNTSKILKRYGKRISIRVSILIVLGMFIYNYAIKYLDEHRALENQSVEVSKCTDGDTAHMVIDGVDETVRFIAIDTPETVKRGTPVQPYGKEASDYTCQSLLSATNIVLEYEENNKTDKYNRKVAWVFVDGKLLQEELISQGLAKVDYIYGDYKYTDRLYKAEEVAKNQRIGIWK